VTDPYRQFLESKIKLDHASGFDVSLEQITKAYPLLKPHQAAIVRWAVQGGCRAIFAAFGLGKTFMQLAIVDLMQIMLPEGTPALIVVPLGVRQEFKIDAEKLGIDVRFVRTDAEVDLDFNGIHLTNYESVREGKINPGQFAVASLDEASILRSFGSKTYQEFLPLFNAVRFKFVATATPSPNRFKELIHYAGFLGIMDTGQALTRFFQRDSQKAGNLTLYPHKEREFWLWLNSWAIFLQKPSDLGFSDEGYELPELDVRYHEVAVDHSDAGADRDGQHRAAITVNGSRLLLCGQVELAEEQAG
jgi:SNF2 family DNA or RNA helicase